MNMRYYIYDNTCSMAYYGRAIYNVNQLDQPCFRQQNKTCLCISVIIVGVGMCEEKPKLEGCCIVATALIHN